MNKKLDCILLLDDNRTTNIFHQKVITIAECAKITLDFSDGKNALEYLHTHDDFLPDLLFIDINMPTMNAWEFLAEFEDLMEQRNECPTVILLSTTLNDEDRLRAKGVSYIKDIMTKPLSTKSINAVMQEFFPVN